MAWITFAESLFKEAANFGDFAHVLGRVPYIWGNDFQEFAGVLHQEV